VESTFASFPELADRRRARAGSLSGGQQQMLALARALIGQPAVLILDEPSLGLAPIVVERLYAKLHELKEQGLAIVVVEEKTQFALQLSDHFVAMSGGLVQTAGEVTGSNTESELIAKSYLG
jgi:branched-chain amino acid transport system ATP-binding protein